MRTDKLNDFMDLDSDQSWQIERHYEDCCKKIKPFNTTHEIIGDMGQVKNGWKYAVWGSTSDPSSWFEQNVTLQGSPQRQLRRRVVMKPHNVIVEEQQSAFEL